MNDQPFIKVRFVQQKSPFSDIKKEKYVIYFGKYLIFWMFLKCVQCPGYEVSVNIIC